MHRRQWENSEHSLQEALGSAPVNNAQGLCLECGWIHRPCGTMLATANNMHFPTQHCGFILATANKMCFHTVNTFVGLG